MQFEGKKWLLAAAAKAYYIKFCKIANLRGQQCKSGCDDDDEQCIAYYCFMQLQNSYLSKHLNFRAKKGQNSLNGDCSCFVYETGRVLVKSAVEMGKVWLIKTTKNGANFPFWNKNVARFARNVVKWDFWVVFKHCVVIPWSIARSNNDDE